MTDFDSVADNKDELLFDLLKEEIGAENEAVLVAANVPANDPYTCSICIVSTNLEVVFLLCKHLCMCKECYENFLADTIAQQTDARANDDDDDYRLDCPLCRVTHKPSQIMTVFKA